MSNKSFSPSMDTLLADKGFARHGSTWARERNPFIDVIELQRGASIPGVTVNVALMHVPTYKMVWEKLPSKPISEVDCTIRTRLGLLLDGRDRWWSAADGRSAHIDLNEAVTSVALPFFIGIAGLADLEHWLDASEVRYPPETLYRAAVKHQLGKEEEALALLHQLTARTASAPWQERIASMARSFG